MLLAAANAHTSAVGSGAEEVILRLLIQIVAILVCTRLVVAVARRLGQTDVTGEILAGLVLGPSLLGAFAPEVMAHLFHSSTNSIFVGLAQIGLILLMFQIGLEFEFHSELKATGRHKLIVISVVGIVVPFLLGYFTAPWFHQLLDEPRPQAFGFRLFFAVAMSITAIPILGRIFLELGLSHTRVAVLTIGAAAINDVFGWLILGAVALLVQDRFSVLRLSLRLGGLLVYLLLLSLVLRPLVKRWLSQQLGRFGQLRQPAMAIILILLFSSAVLTSHLGVFAIIGGFALGVAVHDDRAFVAEWRLRMAPMVNVLFLPLFFTYTGLRTDIDDLRTWNELGQCVLVCLVAFVGKFGGSYIAARAVGEDHKNALTIGTCMNTRALMELVAINIGYDLGVLPRSMFTKLVIMAIVSTFMATPLIRSLMRGHERQEAAILPGNTTPAS